MAWAVAFVVLTVVLAMGRLVPPERNEQVAEAQRLLQEQQLYVGAITGLNDRNTRAAIRRFQMLHNLRATGELDAETLAGLRPRPPSLEPATLEADRRALDEAPLPVAEGPVPSPSEAP